MPGEGPGGILVTVLIGVAGAMIGGYRRLRADGRAVKEAGWDRS